LARRWLDDPAADCDYLGIAVYLAGLKIFRTGNRAGIVCAGPPADDGQSGGDGFWAVVISSQTTSVRAANLLASFIIIPMALLMQAESLIMFWANYPVLWWILAALIVVNILLVRMGLHLFDREELLGREIDELNPRAVWSKFKGFWLRVEPGRPAERFTLDVSIRAICHPSCGG
jgi:hypothetical protein